MKTILVLELDELEFALLALAKGFPAKELVALFIKGS